MDQSDGRNMREFSRVPLHLEARLDIAGKRIPVRATRDLSMKGVFLVCDPQQPVGTPCEVVLVLQGMDPPVEVQFSGQVSRVETSGLGISFAQIDLESFDHLQKLVLYNSQNTDQVEQEMKDHLGLRHR